MSYKINGFYLLLLLFLSSELYAQSKLALGIELEPNISYRRIVKLNNSEATNNYVANRNSIEKPKLSLSKGINITYTAFPNLSFKLTLGYTNKGFQYEQETLLDSSGPIIFKGTIIESNDFYVIAFNTIYYLNKSKLKFFVESGASYNIFNRIKLAYISDELKQVSLFNPGTINPSNFDFLLSLGVENEVTDSKIKYFIAVIGKYGLTTSNKSNDTKEYPYSVGMNIGLIYKLSN